MGFFQNLFGNKNQGIGLFNRGVPSLESFSGANSSISEQELLTIPAAQAALELLTGGVAQLPLNLYKNDKNGMPTLIDNDYRMQLVNNEPNSTLDGYEFKKKIVKDFILYGASKVVIEHINATSNTIGALYPLNTKDLTITVYTKNGVDRFGEVRLSNNSGSYVYNDEDMISVLRNSDDGITGHGVLEMAKDILSLALAQMQYEQGLLANGATPNGVLQLPGKVSNDVMERLQKSWNSKHAGANNVGKTVVLEEGMEYNPISISPDKLQLQNAHKSVISDIARAFNIPESLINSTANKYNSNEMNNIFFIQHSLGPILQAVEKAFNRSLLLEKEKQNNYYFKFDTSDLLNTTLQDKETVASNLFNNGIITLNEARQRLGYNDVAENDFSTNDFIKLSQGNVLYHPLSQKLDILNKGETTDAENVSTDLNEATAKANESESESDNEE